LTLKKTSNITIVVDSCPENPKSVVAEPEWITLTKAIEGDEPAMQLT
jgi:cell wall assembly regulator SMI1